MTEFQKIPYVLKIETPLHIGSMTKQKGMILNPTLMYVPGKVIWGATISALTKRLRINDDDKGREEGGNLGKHLKDMCTFSYAYIFHDKIFYTPKYDKDLCELKWGNLTDHSFKQRFLSSRISTAIDSNSYTSKHGQLYEIESIQPYAKNSNGDILPVYLIGVVWVNKKNIKNNKKFKYNGENILYNGVPIFDEIILGGEQNTGYGRVSISDNKISEHASIFKDNPTSIEVSKNDPILSHLSTDSFSHPIFYGDIDLLIDKKFSGFNGHEKIFTSTSGYYFSPGTTFEKSLTLTTNEYFRVEECK